MARILIANLSESVGQSVMIQGSISVRRDQGKMVFFDFRDMSGTVQGVVLPKSSAMETAKELRAMYAVAVTGVVNQRPEKNVNPEKRNGDIELQIEEIKILNVAQPLPFDLDAPLHLETHLDYLPLTLRTERSRDIFTMQASILDA